MIRVDALTKRYGRNVGVEGLTFAVEQGELVGFLGPNGAGKTTTMRILTGFLTPTSGRAQVNGFDVVEDSLEVRRRVGYLPESAPLYGDMTVRAYLNYMAELKEVPVPARRGRVDAVMEQLEIGHVAGRLVGNLSKGYRQRVGLAQAMVADPQVLILDEATAGLDPAQIIEVRKLIKSLAGERTILFSSHILSEVQAVCQRVIIINRGRLVAEDRTDNLVHRLHQARQMVLRLGTGDGAAAEALLDQAAGIQAFERLAPEDAGPSRQGTAWRLVLDADTGDEPLERLFFSLAEARLPILELRPADSTLEEVFLALVAGKGEDRYDRAREEGDEGA